MTDTSSGFGSNRVRAAGHPYVLDVLPRNADDPDGEYTFVPRDVADDERATRWITADGEDILELSEWR